MTITSAFYVRRGSGVLGLTCRAPQPGRGRGDPDLASVLAYGCPCLSPHGTHISHTFLGPTSDPGPGGCACQCRWRVGASARGRRTGGASNAKRNATAAAHRARLVARPPERAEPRFPPRSQQVAALLLVPRRPPCRTHIAHDGPSRVLALQQRWGCAIAGDVQFGVASQGRYEANTRTLVPLCRPPHSLGSAPQPSLNSPPSAHLTVSVFPAPFFV